MANVLSDFNPKEANDILETCTHEEMVKSFRSMQVFNKIDDKDGKRSAR